MESSISIIGIMINKRTDKAPIVQEVLTKHGDKILSRVGLHNIDERDRGLITLTVQSTKEEMDELLSELSNLEGVRVEAIKMD